MMEKDPFEKYILQSQDNDFIINKIVNDEVISEYFIANLLDLALNEVKSQSLINNYAKFNYPFLASECIISDRVIKRFFNSLQKRKSDEKISYIEIDITAEGSIKDSKLLFALNREIEKNIDESYFFEKINNVQISLNELFLFDYFFGVLSSKVLDKNKTLDKHIFSGYFYKILKKLIDYNTSEIKGYLLVKSKENYLNKLLNLIEEESYKESLKIVLDILLETIEDYSLLESKFDFFRKMTSLLSKSFSTTTDIQMNLNDILKHMLDKKDFITYLISHDTNLLDEIVKVLLSSMKKILSNFQSNKIMLTFIDEYILTQEVTIIQTLFSTLSNIELKKEDSDVISIFKDDLIAHLSLLIEFFCSSINKKDINIQLPCSLQIKSYEKYTKTEDLKTSQIEKSYIEETNKSIKLGLVRIEIIKAIISFINLMNQVELISLIEEIFSKAFTMSNFFQISLLFFLDFENNNIYQVEFHNLFIAITSLKCISPIVISFFITDISDYFYSTVEAKMLNSINIFTNSQNYIIPLYIPTLIEIVSLLVNYSAQNNIYISNELKLLDEGLQNHIYKFFKPKKISLSNNDISKQEHLLELNINGLDQSCVSECSNNQPELNKSENENLIDIKTNYLILLRNLYYSSRGKLCSNQSMVFESSKFTIAKEMKSYAKSKLTKSENKFLLSSVVFSSAILNSQTQVNKNNKPIILNSPERMNDN